MAARGLRVGVVGATGALGTEVLSVLDASRLRVSQLVAVAGEDSLGSDLEFQDEVVPVESELPALPGLDLLLCCAPPAAAPEIARAALRAEVPCIDGSGAFASHAEVPLCWAAGGDPVGSEPLLASPVDAALVWIPLLRALGAPSPRAAQGTVIEAASASGRDGIDALTAESLALFNQQDLPDSPLGGPPLAFDLHPRSGDRLAGGRTRERALASALERTLPGAPSVSARWVQAPVFVGQAVSLRLVFEAPVDAGRAAEALAKARGVEAFEGEGEGPNLRAASGRDVVIAGTPEVESDDPRALRLWAVADVLRLAAANVVALAIGALEARGALDRRGLH